MSNTVALEKREIFCKPSILSKAAVLLIYFLLASTNAVILHVRAHALNFTSATTSVDCSLVSIYLRSVGMHALYDNLYDFIYDVDR